MKVRLAIGSGYDHQEVLSTVCHLELLPLKVTEGALPVVFGGVLLPSRGACPI